MKFTPVKCRMCKGTFQKVVTQHNRICPRCRTPEKMAAAGYGRDDIVLEANVSYERARVAVFGPELKVKAS
jgi:Zn finger protein HypA/HybF involved in hydrogenase expression